MKTETAASNMSIRYTEPTHDEIALTAFLAWERDGRQPGREMQYWLEAENQIRIARQKKAEAAAAQTLDWPRPSRAAQVKKAPAKGAQQLTAIPRGTTPTASSEPKMVTKKKSSRA